MKIANYWVLIVMLFFSITVVAESDDQVATAKQLDSRIKIVLTKPERAIIFAEMRNFLAGLQKITSALAKSDMETVSKLAETLGSKMMRNVAKKSIKPKLPRKFKQLGHSTHNAFDVIAQNAKDLGDSQLILQQLGVALEKCVACHAIYQITLDK